MSALRATLLLVAARAHRRPERFFLTALGLALATAFAGAVAAESTIAGDQGARAVLGGLPALEQTVQVTWPDLTTAATERQARMLLRGLGLGEPTEVVLVNPVRLDGIVVRPAAIEPLWRWVTSSAAPGPCRPGGCPMLLAGGQLARRTLGAPGVRIRIAGAATLRSAAPLGFAPAAAGGQPPLLLSADAAGLDAIAGLASIYRTHSWLAPLPIAGLHSWQLAGFEQRLAQAQASLLASASAFSLSAPFAAIDSARGQASAARRRLLLAGGGALAALALFIVLAASGLRRDIDAERRRLDAAGARAGHALLFVSAEAGLLCAVALLAGAALAVAGAALLASMAGAPVAPVLEHSLLNAGGAAALALGWVGATALIVVLLLARSARAADVLALAALAALALSLGRGGAGPGDPLPLLLAPLCFLAAGVLVFRGAGALLRCGERLARRGPVLARLAFVGLARAPGAPSLAIAFIAVSIGLGGFALAYRATLSRGSADQAADRVPLDAIVAPGADFTAPLALATLSRWRSLAAGSVWPVRRTDASFVSGSSSVTVPALGLPAAALLRLHGWRGRDGSDSLATLATRLVPAEPARAPGPALPAGARVLELTASSPAIAVTVTAELRNRDGDVHALVLGQASANPGILGARLPAGGPWELEALALSEPAGLEITNGHQNGENAAAATRFASTVGLSSPRVLDGSRLRPLKVRLGSWHATGAASLERLGQRSATIRFATSGQLGLLRPLAPSDIRPVPVLTDPVTAAAASRSGWLALTADGLPVNARVVGVLRRFPTVPADAAGFVIADQQTLSGALDAQAPGQGRPDELWISTAHPAALRSALHAPRFAALASSFRTDVERQLRSAPIGRAVLRTLLGAAGLSGALAVVGLLVALLGSARDERIERDLIAQGVGPRGLRRELRMRLVLAAILGVGAGLLVGIVLTRLAVATVRASGPLEVPHPALVTVAPWRELATWGLAAIATLTLAGWAATRSLIGRGAP